MTYDDLRESQRIPGEDSKVKQLLDMPKSEAERAGSGPRRTSKLNINSPSHQKFDPKLKKNMLATEKERQDKAKRDAVDERQREMQEFKSQGNSAAANIIMPKYKHDDVLDCDREH